MLLHIYVKYILPLIVVIRGGPVAQGHHDPQVTNTEQSSGGNQVRCLEPLLTFPSTLTHVCKCLKAPDLICIVDLLTLNSRPAALTPACTKLVGPGVFCGSHHAAPLSSGTQTALQHHAWAISNGKATNKMHKS